MPRRAAVALVAVALVVVAGLVSWRLLTPDTAMEQGLSLAPADTSRVSWTDWEAVRRELGADVDAGSSPEAVDAFLADAFAADLSAMSALGSSAAVMQPELGFSPATISWELFAQSPDGAVEVMGVGDEVSLDEVADRLTTLGWTEPEDDDGVWVGGPDVLTGVGPGLTPELQHFVLLADRGVILSSDQAPYLEQVREVVDGDAGAAGDLADLSADLGDPLAAAIYDGDHACERLAMSQADDDAQAEADQLVEAAGGIHPLTGFAMGLLPGGDLRAVMEVEDADDAPGDAEARARLAAGPAPGQGGDFSDRFAVTGAGSDGTTITLDLRPEDGEYVLSDLTSGPVLFATC
ncbi:hypothetical protein SAMN05192575_101751 [Nocardioides alpinus]|uniref:Uncharacterized protein n=1 Tax=Nocardioides alpinus TaxID=748909 RepID=A0A1I0W7J0_9ACTN|nr:hypothetical protein [Nocardioides alpinus]PKH37729.1 hypothetical protein CXG46_20120 [Nocardioides alpinus]SFA84258.1 hypothetical protein SAMN05192575_101751 [Nocardioides alpinus]